MKRSSFIAGLFVAQVAMGVLPKVVLKEDSVRSGILYWVSRKDIRRDGAIYLEREWTQSELDRNSEYFGSEPIEVVMPKDGFPPIPQWKGGLIHAQ